MYRVFNMGHRMEIFCPAWLADNLIEISLSFGVDARVVGHCETSDRKLLTIRTPSGDFLY
jgi:phosphoribosylformylglycinamidine cyclo-ligase